MVGAVAVLKRDREQKHTGLYSTCREPVISNRLLFTYLAMQVINLFLKNL